jgi:signal transduction histidine kinase
MALVHPADRAATLAMHVQIRRGRPTASFQNRVLTKSGLAIPVMWSAAWSRRHGAIFAVARDMRESLAAQEKQRQAQKMEAVGRLTSGLAHDFNNLLTIIVGGAEALAESLAPGSEAHDLAQLTLEAGRRGADLVESLLTFSRGQPLDPRPIDVRALLSGLEPLIRGALDGRIEVDIAARGAIACLADRAQLESAILNLVINARDAMPGGGRLTIRARAAELGPGRLAGTGKTPGPCVRLSVSDTGEGMVPETLERAMEPFFTTKGVGEGSGLGLATVHGFVNQSGGWLRLRSSPGRGTRVDLFLPAASLPAAPLSANSPPRIGLVREVASRTVLVVEDDAGTRASLVRSLAAAGFRVLESDSGAGALELLGARDDIDLLVIELVLQGAMNGRQLADHAHLLRPGLRVLFTTGHTDDEVVRVGRAYSPDHVLRKPYRRAELAAKVAMILDRRPPTP